MGKHLVSNLMNAYDQVTTREQLHTEEARDAFVITFRNNIFGREEFKEFAWAHRNLQNIYCLLYTSPSPRDGLLSRMPSSA